MAEKKDNSGALFQNDRKQNEKQPDRTGHITVAGVDYWLSGSIKKDKNGKTYMSVAVNPKQPQQAQPTEGQAEQEEVHW